MTVAWSGSLLEPIIYLLCVATSLLCAYLLARAYHRGRTKLSVWSALCFGRLFCARFWVQSRDGLFLAFAASFWLLAANEAAVEFLPEPIGGQSWY